MIKPLMLSFTNKLLVLFFLFILVSPVVNGATSNLLPTGWGDTADWTPEPEKISWDKLTTADTDTTYIYTTTATDEIEVSHVDGSFGVISNVRLIAGLRATSGTPDIVGGLVIGGSTYVASAWTISNAYASFFADWSINPETSLPWTEGDVNGLQSSLNFVSGVVEVRCTQLYLRVTDVGGNTNLIPDADGSTTDWNVYPANWSNLLTADTDTTYVYTDVNDNVSEVVHAGSLSGVNISNVRLIAGLRATVGTPDVTGGLILSGTTYEAAPWTISSSWASYTKDWAVSPATSVAWTEAEVNSLRSSINFTAGATEVRCTQIYFTITYNYIPTLSSPSPSNGSTASITPTLQVTCHDLDNEAMTATWSSNWSGSWVDFATNTSIPNGTTIIQTDVNFTAYETTYWWRVNVTDGNGNWVNVTYHLVTASAVTAGFSWSPTNPYEDATTSFTDNSTGGVNSWSWSFGDGGSSSARNPTHVFTRSGLFNVRLTASNGYHSDDITQQLTVAESGGGGGGPGGGGGGSPGGGDDDGDDTGDLPAPFIPSPDFSVGLFFTVDEMFMVNRIDELPESNAHIRIVSIDSGIYPQVYGEHDLSSIEQYAHPSFGSITDELGHGTWVANVLSWGKYNKLPNLEIISYKVFNRLGGCTPDMFLEALEDVKHLNPDIVTISAGAHGWPDDAFGQKVQELTNRGIIVVAAAGNVGPSANSILSPASSRCTIAVGAVDPLNTFKDYTDDYVPAWSSRGPVDGVNYIKPDCVAPGYEILGPYGSSDAIVSGTSMSVPFVAVGLATVYANNNVWMDLANMLWWWEGDTKQEMMLEADFKALNDSIFMMSMIRIILAIALYSVIIGLIVYYFKYYKKRKKGGKRQKTGITTI
jgi:PKD repeat protein